MRETKRRSFLVVAPAVLALGACAPEPITRCEGSSQTAVCGFAKPEDLTRIPNTPLLLVIEHGDETASAGFSVLDTRTNTRTELPWTHGDRGAAGSAGPCSAPPEKFSPGGIDLVKSDEGFRVLAVNRASPSRIEQFTLRVEAGAPALTWNHCVTVPDGIFLNDIAAMPDGGFVATHMVSPSAARSAVAPLRFFFGFGTGYVMRWNTGSAWRKIEDSDGSFPNGIAVAADGNAIYFAETFGEAVNRIELSTGKRTRRKLSFQPDNLTWNEAGELITVGHAGLPLLTTGGCRILQGASCGFAVTAIALSADLSHAQILLRSDGKTIPGASTALLNDGVLWLGTSFGDRVSRVSVSSQTEQIPPASR